MLATAERKPLGTLLINRGIIAAAQLEKALCQQRETGKKKLLGEILIEQKVCSEEQIASSLAAAYGIPFAHVSPRMADPAAVAVLPYEFLCRKNVLPLFLVEDVLTVAVSEPTNLFLTDELACRSGHAVQIVAATAREIRATLEVYLPAEKAFVVDDLPVWGSETVAFASAPSSKSKVDPPVARLVESTLQNALKLRATEVHFEPGRASLRIRFRVDGRLIEHHRPPHRTSRSVPHLQENRGDYQGTEGLERQRGFLFRIHLLFLGHPHRPVHPHLRRQPHVRMDCARSGTIPE